MNNRDFRAIFFYEYKLGHNAAQATRNIIGAFGELAISERTVQWWFKRFKSGNTNLDNEERGRPNTVIDNNKLKILVEADPCTTVRELAEQLDVSKSTVSDHLCSIGKSKKLRQMDK